MRVPRAEEGGELLTNQTLQLRRVSDSGRLIYHFLQNHQIDPRFHTAVYFTIIEAAAITARWHEMAAILSTSVPSLEFIVNSVA
jgi:hypothetical protein